jgi:hypothetical protein
MIDIASAAVTASKLVSEEINSARPGAPPIPYVERPPRLRRARLLLSAALHRVASAVAPASVVAPAEVRPAC